MRAREDSRDLPALLLALGIDNLGSGSFLPLTVLYLVRAVHLDVGVAGVLVGVASLAGLAVPALTARVVDRVGARPLVATSQLVQALGMAAFLAARDPVVAALAVVLSVAGLQLFYSCLTALVVEVAGPGPTDHPFALVTRVRAATFGLGALVGASIASLADPRWMRVTVAGNLATFILAAVIVWVGVRTNPRVRAREGRPVAVLASRPFVGLMVVAFCTTLPYDFFLSGNAVYVTRNLGVGAWTIGASVALLTAFTAALSTLAVRLTDRLRRPTTLAIGVALLGGWIVTSAVAAHLPAGSRTGVVLGSAVLLALASVVPTARLAAMAEATAPEGNRGRFLAVFQYPFSVAQVVGPALTSLLAVAGWLPWAVLAAFLLLALVMLRWLDSVLPERALRVGVDDSVSVRR